MYYWYKFRKYTSVISLKDKKIVIITNDFQKILKESSRKTNKILIKVEDFKIDQWNHG